MTKPEDINGIKRLCGLVQYMARFMPDLADTLEPIRKLTRKGLSFDWNEHYDIAFRRVKEQLTKAHILAYFNPDKDLILQVDSSQNGLGAALLQSGQPIEFASRSLSQLERKSKRKPLQYCMDLKGLTSIPTGKKLLFRMITNR